MKRGSRRITVLYHLRYWLLLSVFGTGFIACGEEGTNNSVAPIIGSFTTSPSQVPQGEPTEITWSFSFSNDPTPFPSCSIDHEVGKVTNGQTTSITLPEDTVFTLSCTNKAGTDTAQFQITIVVTWQKMFGGTDDDFASSIVETIDSGLVVAGHSASTDISGVTNHGEHDYYLIKLSGDGNL